MAVDRPHIPVAEELRELVGQLHPPELDALQKLIAARRKELAKSGLTVRRELPLRDAILWSVAALFIFFAIDGLIFHSGWYMKYLEPNSSAGQVESQLFWLRHEAPAV